MGTEKRARQKAGRQARIEAALAAQKKAESRSKIVRTAIFIALAVIAVGALLYSKRDENKTVDAAGTPTSAFPGGTNPGGTLPGGALTPPTTPGGAIPPASIVGKTISGATPCPSADGSSPRTTKFEQAPPVCINPSKAYTANVATTKGNLTIKLDPKAAPKAVNNFVVLARYHYYDGIIFHRVIPGFVVQGGDASGSGSGSTGYKFDDELPADKSLYKSGTVAMANAGANTNDSQFYIVLSDTNGLEAKYSIFGQVTEGFDTTVKAIEKGGSSGGTPTDPAYMTTVTITET